MKKTILVLSLLFLLPLVIAGPGLEITGTSKSGVIELIHPTTDLNQSTADTLYWRLDASNDPPTASWNMGRNFLEWVFSLDETGFNGLQWRDPDGAFAKIYTDTDNFLRVDSNKTIFNATLEAPNLCYSNGTNCVASGGSGGNLTWNETRANNLYVPYNGATSAVNLATKEFYNTSQVNVTQATSSSKTPFNIIGGSTDGTSDPGDGVAFFMTHNGAGNRQFVYGATDDIRNGNSNACIRFLFGSSYTPSLDAVRCDGSNRAWVALGTDSTGVTVGSQMSYYQNAPAKISIVSHAGVKAIGVYDAIYPSTSGTQFEVNNSGGIYTKTELNASKIFAVNYSSKNLYGKSVNITILNTPLAYCTMQFISGLMVSDNCTGDILG